MTTTKLNSSFCIWYRIKELLRKKSEDNGNSGRTTGVATFFIQSKDPINNDELNTHKTIHTYID